jgi:transposase
MAPPILTPLPKAAVLIGVDTHKDQHVAVALDRHGAVLGHLQIPATSKGYETLLEWAVGHGALQPADLLVALEGSGSYGAGLCRHLLAAGCSVREVSRPNRQHGKDDWIDAEMAARSLLAGTATAEPKTSDGPVEMLRLLKSTKDSAVHARTRAINQLKALLVTVPTALREQLQTLRNKELLERCAQLRPGAIATPLAAARLALRSLARRIQQLSAEIEALVLQLDAITNELAPQLTAAKGIGTDNASALLIAAGDNPPTTALRSGLCVLVRCGTHARQLRQNPSASVEPRWQPSSE